MVEYERECTHENNEFCYYQGSSNCMMCNRPRLVERNFTVYKKTTWGTCEINLTEEDLDGKTEQEIIEYVEECAVDSDMWRINESEDDDIYEVEED